MKWIAVIVLAAACMSAGGCADKAEAQRSGDLDTRSQEALRDPFGYSPTFDRSVSGGGLGEFDKDAFRKDVQSVFNP